jgi:uncharacterized protein
VESRLSSPRQVDRTVFALAERHINAHFWIMTAPQPIDLNRLTDSAKTVAARGLPPVHLWNPPFCGAIDIRIASDGTWFYLGTPIGRMPLVKLFSSILRRDPERFVLVTPVEMVEITVDDAPFMAIDMDVVAGPAGPTLSFRTNVDDQVDADADHPIRFKREEMGGYRPYVMVRAGLEARLTRRLYQELVGLGTIRDFDGAPMFGIESAGAFFAMAPAAEVMAE